MFYLRFKKKFCKQISESLIFAYFLFFCERCEWIAHFAQIKWAMWVNRSFRSPKMRDHEQFAQVAQRKWGLWANRSFRPPKMSEWVIRSFAHFLTKNEWFARKSNERIPSPVWVPLKSDCNIWRFPAILLMYSALIWTGRFKLAFTTCILMYSAHCRQPWETSQTNQDDDQDLAKRRRERESHRG